MCSFKLCPSNQKVFPIPLLSAREVTYYAQNNGSIMWKSLLGEHDLNVIILCQTRTYILLTAKDRQSMCVTRNATRTALSFTLQCLMKDHVGETVVPASTGKGIMVKRAS